MDDVLVGFGVALLVINVPAERFEERIEEFAAELRFVVLAGLVGLEVLLEAVDKLDDFRWATHFGRSESESQSRRGFNTSEKTFPS